MRLCDSRITIKLKFYDPEPKFDSSLIHSLNSPSPEHTQTKIK
jgi:hypothetical protein